MDQIKNTNKQADGYKNQFFSTFTCPSTEIIQNFEFGSSPLYKKNLSKMHSSATGLKLFAEQVDDDNEIARSLPIKSHFARLEVIFNFRFFLLSII